MSSFFNNEFTDLRTNIEFNTFVGNAEDYKNSQEYANLVAAAQQKRVDARRQQVCMSILNHFNSENSSDFNTNDTNLTFFVGDLSADDIANLTSALEAKGYTVTVVGDQMTVSSPPTV